MIRLPFYSHWITFFHAWLADPLRVASITPSGQALAGLITREIPPDAGQVLELGAGTGVFTRALLDRGIGEHELTLVEFGPEFARLLEAQFPRARVFQMDAAQLSRPEVFSGAQVAAAVSGLPLIVMSRRKVFRVLSGAFRFIRSGGALYQFTYGPVCPVPKPILYRLGLRATRVGWTMRNFPPAAVYRITRCPPVALGRWPKPWQTPGRASFPPPPR